MDKKLTENDNSIIEITKKGDLNILNKYLEEGGFNSINFQDQNGDTALHHAIGKNDLFQLLLRFGANPEIKNNGNKTVKDILLDNYNNTKEHFLLLNQKYKEKLEKLDYLFNLFTTNQTIELSKEEINEILPNFETLPGKTNILLFENNFIDFDWIKDIQGEVIIFIIANNKFNIESITKIKEILIGKKYLISLIIDENKTELKYYQIERRPNILRNNYPIELKPYVNFLDYLELDEHIHLDKMSVQIQMKKKYNFTFEECEKILDNMMEEGLIYMPNEYSYARIK